MLKYANMRQKCGKESELCSGYAAKNCIYADMQWLCDNKKTFYAVIVRPIFNGLPWIQLELFKDKPLNRTPSKKIKNIISVIYYIIVKYNLIMQG